MLSTPAAGYWRGRAGERRGARRAPPGPYAGVPAHVAARPAWIGRFDRWAASYDASPLQGALYTRVHEAVLRAARCHVQDPRQVLDVGCGTGRLAGRIGSVYPRAHVVGLDASTGMIGNARTVLTATSPRFVLAVAERLPFSDAVFDLVVITLSLSHWRDQATGLAEVSRVMAPNATLIAAEVLPDWPSRRASGKALRRRHRSRRLAQLITASGLRVRRAEPVRSVAQVAGASLIAAEKPR